MDVSRARRRRLLLLPLECSPITCAGGSIKAAGKWKLWRLSAGAADSSRNPKQRGRVPSPLRGRRRQPLRAADELTSRVWSGPLLALNVISVDQTGLPHLPQASSHVLISTYFAAAERQMSEPGGYDLRTRFII